jgi:hypothetical protein
MKGRPCVFRPRRQRRRGLDGALSHAGVGDFARLGPLTMVMKGESILPHSECIVSAVRGPLCVLVRKSLTPRERFNGQQALA